MAELDAVNPKAALFAERTGGDPRERGLEDIIKNGCGGDRSRAAWLAINILADIRDVFPQNSTEIASSDLVGRLTATFIAPSARLKVSSHSCAELQRLAFIHSFLASCYDTERDSLEFYVKLTLRNDQRAHSFRRVGRSDDRKPA